MPFESEVRDRQGPGYALIETFRREADGNIPRRDRHLARLGNSARELGFDFDRAQVEQQLESLDIAGASRVRLELSRDGRLDVTIAPFSPLQDEAIWRIAIASIRLDAGDPLRRHKTTLRDIYACARAEYPTDLADEVVLLNTRGELAEGTITNLFIDLGDDVLSTPPLSSGALPGVLRGELIDAGRARERRLTPGDLVAAKAVFVGNSLRGLIRAGLEHTR